MTKKTPIHLTIDADLYDAIMAYKAVHNDFSISEKLEEYIRIVIEQPIEEGGDTIDIDKEKARLVLELRKLESKAELQKKAEDKEKMKLATLDRTIDNAIEHGHKPEEIPEDRGKGIQYLFKSVHNVDLTRPEAEELIRERLKERGML